MGVSERSAVGIFTIDLSSTIVHEFGTLALKGEVTPIDRSVQAVALSKTQKALSVMVPSYLAVCILSLIEVISQRIR